MESPSRSRACDGAATRGEEPAVRQEFWESCSPWGPILEQLLTDGPCGTELY